MNISVPHLGLAERLVDSDLIAPRTQRAIIAALQAADGERVQPAQFIAASKQHRAKVRVVGAACGWARCEHCGEWRDIGAEPSAALEDCACCLELHDDETFAGFALFHYCGGEVCASLSLPASVTERMERFQAMTGGAEGSSTRQSPARDATAS
jgi:hypothetical protein